MADFLLPIGNGQFKRLVDQGDGTWAEAVAIAGASGLSGLAVDVSKWGGVAVDPLNTDPVPVTLARPTTATHRLVSAANSNNATSVKAAAAVVFHIRGYNAAASLRYLKLYNKASSPTVGTDVPFAVFVLKATDSFQFNWPEGLPLDTGLAYGLVTGNADADNTSVTAADITNLNIDYA